MKRCYPYRAGETPKLQRNLTAARADNTRRVYDQAWRRFTGFASAHHAEAMPADPAPWSGSISA